MSDDGTLLKVTPRTRSVDKNRDVPIEKQKGDHKASETRRTRKARENGDAASGERRKKKKEKGDVADREKKNDQKHKNKKKKLNAGAVNHKEDASKEDAVGQLWIHPDTQCPLGWDRDILLGKTRCSPTPNATPPKNDPWFCRFNLVPTAQLVVLLKTLVANRVWTTEETHIRGLRCVADGVHTLLQRPDTPALPTMLKIVPRPYLRNMCEVYPRGSGLRIGADWPAVSLTAPDDVPRLMGLSVATRPKTVVVANLRSPDAGAYAVLGAANCTVLALCRPTRVGWGMDAPKTCHESVKGLHLDGLSDVGSLVEGARGLQYLSLRGMRSTKNLPDLRELRELRIEGGHSVDLAQLRAASVQLVGTKIKFGGAAFAGLSRLTLDADIDANKLANVLLAASSSEGGELSHKLVALVVRGKLTLISSGDAKTLSRRSKRSDTLPRFGVLHGLRSLCLVTPNAKAICDLLRRDSLHSLQSFTLVSNGAHSDLGDALVTREEFGHASIEELNVGAYVRNKERARRTWVPTGSPCAWLGQPRALRKIVRLSLIGCTLPKGTSTSLNVLTQMMELRLDHAKFPDNEGVSELTELQSLELLHMSKTNSRTSAKGWLTLPQMFPRLGKLRVELPNTFRESEWVLWRQSPRLTSLKELSFAGAQMIPNSLVAILYGLAESNVELPLETFALSNAFLKGDSDKVTRAFETSLPRLRRLKTLLLEHLPLHDSNVARVVAHMPATTITLDLGYCLAWSLLKTQFALLRRADPLRALSLRGCALHGECCATLSVEDALRVKQNCDRKYGCVVRNKDSSHAQVWLDVRNMEELKKVLKGLKTPLERVHVQERLLLGEFPRTTLIDALDTSLPPGAEDLACNVVRGGT